MRDLYRYFGNINFHIPSTCTKDHPNVLYHFLGKLEPEDMFNFRVRSLEGLHNQANTLLQCQSSKGQGYGHIGCIDPYITMRERPSFSGRYS